MGGLEWWHIVIIVAALFVLFGYKKLPSATKSIAQSMKIFRDETRGLRGGDEHPDVPVGEYGAATNSGTGALAAPALAPAPPVTVAPPAAQPAPTGQPATDPGAYAAGGQQPR